MTRWVITAMLVGFALLLGFAAGVISSINEDIARHAANLEGVEMAIGEVERGLEEELAGLKSGMVEIEQGLEAELAEIKMGLERPLQTWRPEGGMDTLYQCVSSRLSTENGRDDIGLRDFLTHMVSGFAEQARMATEASVYFTGVLFGCWG